MKNLLLYSWVLMLYAGNNLDSSFIKLEYIGENTKPISAIIFYIDSSFKTPKSVFGYTFKISENEFKLIENTIKNNNSELKSDSTTFHYQFFISSINYEFTSRTNTKKSTQEMFNKILDNLDNSETKSSVKGIFGDTIRRLY